MQLQTFLALLFGRIVNACLSAFAADLFEKPRRHDDAWRATHVTGSELAS